MRVLTAVVGTSWKVSAPQQVGQLFWGEGDVLAAARKPEFDPSTHREHPAPICRLVLIRFSPLSMLHAISAAGLKTVANQSVYSATKFAVRAFCEGLRQEAGDKLRVTIVTPGFVRTDFINAVPDPVLRADLAAARNRMAIPPDAIARAIAFAIEEPSNVDVNEIVVRPTAQA